MCLFHIVLLELEKSNFVKCSLIKELGITVFLNLIDQHAYFYSLDNDISIHEIVIISRARNFGLELISILNNCLISCIFKLVG